MSSASPIYMFADRQASVITSLALGGLGVLLSIQVFRLPSFESISDALSTVTVGVAALLLVAISARSTRLAVWLFDDFAQVRKTWSTTEFPRAGTGFVAEAGFVYPRLRVSHPDLGGVTIQLPGEFRRAERLQQCAEIARRWAEGPTRT